jgi:hypothetical protein
MQNIVHLKQVDVMLKMFNGHEKKIVSQKYCAFFLTWSKVKCKKWKDNLKKIMDLRNKCEINDKNGKKVIKTKKKWKRCGWNESMKDK